MNVKTLLEKVGTVAIVDVRYPNEWEAGHIDGARHVPLDYLYDQLDDLDRTMPIVTVCRVGGRSEEAAAILRDKGFEADSLDGGMVEWASRGLGIVGADGNPGTLVNPEAPPDERPPEMQRLQNEFLDTIFAVKAHFADHEPTEDEIRIFLRDRLIAEGKTAEEAEHILDGGA
ncbi:MAG: rhodanese-like domain-containing protein [Acidimicrobiales bacterium]